MSPTNVVFRHRSPFISRALNILALKNFPQEIYQPAKMVAITYLAAAVLPLLASALNVVCLLPSSTLGSSSRITPLLLGDS